MQQRPPYTGPAAKKKAQSRTKRFRKPLVYLFIDKRQHFSMTKNVHYSMTFLLAACVIFALPSCGRARSLRKNNDVVYGRKFGTALTFDVVKPAHPNGAGLVWIVSSGWRSDKPPAETLDLLQPFLVRGYTVFVVIHGSQPRYSMVDILADLKRAVRFIRTNANDYRIYADRLSVYGASSGGHLALLLATEPDDGDKSSADPVERQPCRVQNVVAIAPPSDFLNYGGPGLRAEDGPLKPFAAGFAYEALDRAGKFEPISDPKQRDQITSAMSPINHVSRDTAPVMIIHGDNDKVVPIEQSLRFIDKLKSAGVACTLVIKKDRGHDFPGFNEYLADMNEAANWIQNSVRSNGVHGKTKRQ